MNTQALIAKTAMVPTLKRVVEAKLEASGALTYAKRGRFGTNPLGLESDNSLLLEFQGVTPEARYKMLVSFISVDLRNTIVQRKIARCRDLFQFDLAVFCTCQSFSPDDIYTLKNAGVHLLNLPATVYSSTQFGVIPDFIHVSHLEYEISLQLNLVANEVVKRLRKKFHLVLSEVAAESYDVYGTFPTKDTMRFEDELLRDTLEEYVGAKRKKRAIDVGCGNGRHSRVLAKYFDDVIAFDLSHRMIEAARSKDLRQLAHDCKPIQYYECDIEYEQFPDEESIRGKVDFVCASFGMPSFVEDTASFIRRIYGWLVPQGRALFTFYNSQSLSLALDTPWKEKALSASIDLARHALEVRIRQNVQFSVYCRAYDDRVGDIVKTAFSVCREAYFPHVMAILPPVVFGTDEQPKITARDLFPRIDRAISGDSGPKQGHYVFLVCEKAEARKEGFLRVKHALDSAAVHYKVLTHEEVVSTAEVQKLLSLPEEQMVKTLVLKNVNANGFLVALVRANSRVSFTRLAQLSGCDPIQIVLAPAKEVKLFFDFPIGGIAPCGYDQAVPIFVDRQLIEGQGPFYMGAGDNTKTITLSKTDFLRLIEGYQQAELIDS